MSEKLVLPVLPPSPRELKLAEEARAKAKMRRLRRCVERYKSTLSGGKDESMRMVYTILWFCVPITYFSFINGLTGNALAKFMSNWFILGLLLLPIFGYFFIFSSGSIHSIHRRLRERGYKDALTDSELEIVTSLVLITEGTGRLPIKLPHADDILNTPSSPLVSPVSFVRLLRQYNGIKRKKGRRR